jgi:hypothetical protein
MRDPKAFLFQAALWCFARTDSFKEAIRLAAIPEHWTAELVWRD